MCWVVAHCVLSRFGRQVSGNANKERRKKSNSLPGKLSCSRVRSSAGAVSSRSQIDSFATSIGDELTQIFLKELCGAKVGERR